MPLKLSRSAREGSRIPVLDSQSLIAPFRATVAHAGHRFHGVGIAARAGLAAPAKAKARPSGVLLPVRPVHRQVTPGPLEQPVDS
jgi:hypothetical protein